MACRRWKWQLSNASGPSRPHRGSEESDVYPTYEKILNMPTKVRILGIEKKPLTENDRSCLWCKTGQDDKQKNTVKKKVQSISKYDGGMRSKGPWIQVHGGHVLWYNEPLLTDGSVASFIPRESKVQPHPWPQGGYHLAGRWGWGDPRVWLLPQSCTLDVQRSHRVY